MVYCALLTIHLPLDKMAAFRMHFWMHFSEWNFFMYFDKNFTEVFS